MKRGNQPNCFARPGPTNKDFKSSFGIPGLVKLDVTVFFYFSFAGVHSMTLDSTEPSTAISERST
jgi:hypothetical protein